MKSKNLNILFLGGAERVSLAQSLKNSGEKHGYNVSIFSYDLTTEVPITLEGTVIKGLPWSDPAVVDDIVKTSLKHEINIILPMVNGSIEIASKCKGKLKNIFIPVSDAEVVKSLFDKVEAAKVFKEIGFPIPKTYSILSAKIPVIVKPRRGGSSKGIKIFHDIDDLMHLHNLQDYIIQEYLEYCKEYTVDSYIDSEGRILVIVPRERIEVKGGESTRSLTCRIPEIEDISRKVIKEFRLRGPVNLQFLHDLDNDRYLLMEVNPRFGGATMCSILAGAPLTDYVIEEAIGEKLKPCTDWKEGTLLARYFKEAVFYN